MALTHIVAVRNAITDLVVDKIDIGATDPSGDLEYTTSGDVEVATCAFSNPAFDDSGAAGGNADGLATANAITDDTSATGGVVAKCIIRDRNNAEVFRGSVTGLGGGGDIEISNTTVGAGDTVQTTSLTYEAPN